MVDGRIPSSLILGCSRCTRPIARRANPDAETTDWRARRGKTGGWPWATHRVRREETASAVSYPYPTGFLAYRSRQSRRAARQAPRAASATLKTLCTLLPEPLCLTCAGCPVLLPQQQQRHPFARELLMDVCAVRHDVLGHGCDERKQPCFQRGVIQPVWQRP